jgi:hypothetical protein
MSEKVSAEKWPSIPVLVVAGAEAEVGGEGRAFGEPIEAHEAQKGVDQSCGGGNVVVSQEIFTENDGDFEVQYRVASCYVYF